jgi:hypothetical protein
MEMEFRRGARDAPWKDRALALIFRKHQSDRGSRWRSILLLLFWHDLEVIAKWSRSLDKDEPALWSNVLWSFHEVVWRLDPDQRRERIIQKVRNDTIHDLKLTYSSEPLRSGQFASLDRPSDPDDPPPFEPVAPVGSDWTEMQARLETEAGIRLLESLALRGVIAKRDLPLLLGTIIYGQTIVEWADESGVSRETAKKRRQRALARISPESLDLKKC